MDCDRHDFQYCGRCRDLVRPSVSNGAFFLLSGYFAKLVTERKGAKQFLWNRCVRIVFPFLLFYPFLLAGITIVFVFAISYLDEPRGLMGVIVAASKSAETTERPPLTTMHLWFLYYLAFFSLLAALLSQWSLKLPQQLSFLSKLWWLAPLILVPAVLRSGVPLPAPESFVPDWWPFVFYGSFFAAGWQLFGRESLLPSWQPYRWHLLIGSSLLYLLYYQTMPVLDLNALEPPVSSIQGMDWLNAILTAYLSVSLTLLSLLLGQQLLSKRSAFLRFIADSSYWVYLVHLPIVLFLQTLLIPLEAPWVIKVAIVIVGTLVASMSTYVVFVRYTPLGWLLHGKRQFP